MTRVRHLEPLKRGRAPREYRNRGGFKTIELNAAGWSALIAGGAVAGAAASLASRAPLVPTIMLGVVGGWAALLGLDHRRWRNSTVSLSRNDLSAETYAEAVERLRAMGIAVSARELVDDDTGDVHRALACRQADLDAVEKVLGDVIG